MAQLANKSLILKVFLPIFFPKSLLAQILKYSKTSSIVIFCEKFMEVKPRHETIRNGRAGGVPDFGTSNGPYQAYGPKLLTL